MEELLENQEVQENEVTNVVEEEKAENIAEEVKEEKVEALENAPIAAEKNESAVKRFFKKLWAILQMEV